MSALADQAARELICGATGETLFVNAGAGSGKTKGLVDRVAKMVLEDQIPLRNIAAVTFTEKAGAELRDRLRARFEFERREREDTTLPDDALTDLDTASIGTLHAFAQRILTTHPIEAGLPPLIEVLDEVGSSVAFDERWSVMQRQLLDDPELTDPLVLALSVRITFDQLRSLARAFGYDWDLIESHVLAIPASAARLPDTVALGRAALALGTRASTCRDPEDNFVKNLRAIEDWAARLAVSTTDGQRYATLLDAAGLKLSHGRGSNWDDLPALKADCQSFKDAAQEAADAFADATMRPLAHWIAGRVRSAALERAAEGRLEFHDLLVLARDVLRNNAEVRASLHAQYPHLLLDEFQDTDPIQIEIAVRIAGGAEASADNWRDVVVPAGSLFVVGDPKQSIYRFRRASIRTYLEVGRWISRSVSLSTNFRTTEPVLRWINTVFAKVIDADEGMQPTYEPLDPFRDGGVEGPPVLTLGTSAHEDNPVADAMREREAADVAAVIDQAIGSTWTTYDPKTQQTRPLEYSDIAVLLPARTSLPILQDALDRAGIPYRAESSSLVYQFSEIRDLMAAARTIADPSDLLSCVTALRSPLFGCRDTDLWSWKRDGRSLNLLAPIAEENSEHPVGVALRYLQRLSRTSTWQTPSELLSSLIADRRMLEVAAGRPRARDQWRRLRFVVDHARAWSETQHGGLRAYLSWAARQADESSRVAEAILPETDINAIRIMTIHAAKGLEFPMVILSGMTSTPRTPRGVQVLWTDEGYAAKLSKNVQTNDFEAAQPLDEQMDAYERRRLLYVAATRARDHLVISLHRKGSGGSNAHLLAEHAAEVEAVQFEPVEPSTTEPTTTDPAAPPEFTSWLANLQRAQESTRSKPAISASGLEGTDPDPADAFIERDIADGTAKGGRDVELPPWSKGRYGSAVGRAVHSVLQTIDLGTGEGLIESAAAQSAAEGVVEYAEQVAAVVKSALDSELIKRAAVRDHWRESYIGTVQPDGTVLEGFVDLIYREDDGTLVIIDYKTDAIPASAVSSRVTYYRPQIAAYGEVVEAATGASKIRGELLFIQPNAALSAPVAISGPPIDEFNDTLF